MTWALNDHVTRAGLSRQLHSFARCGYGGVMIQPWGGTPYGFMSRSWLDRLAWAVELAARQGLGVWLWDDWLFPSGFAGGELGKEDRHKSKKLKVLVDLTLEAGETGTLPVPPRFLSVGLVEINKYNNPVGPARALQPTGRQGSRGIRYFAEKRSRLIVVGWEMVSGMRHTVRSHSLYLKKAPESWIYSCDDMDAWSCDLLNPETTSAYLGLIHENYWKRLKQHFGKTIHGFWYDEPHLPTIFPWTPGLTDIFQKRKGYDLTPFLVSIFLKRSNMGYEHVGDPVSLIHDDKLKAVLADYHDVWTSLLAENFYGVIQNWCHEHGVLSIGHQGADETLNTLLSNGGLFFKNMERADMPGIDVIWGQVAPGRFEDFPRIAGSRASLAGKPFAVSESFAASGHGTYLDEMRFLAEHQIIRGINHFLVEIASYNAKKSFFYHPPEVNPTINPMIRHYGKWLHQRRERVSTLLNQGRASSKSCLYVPVQNYYKQAPQPITDQIAALARELTYHQREFDYAWDSDLAEMVVRDGMLVSSGGQTYGEIIIPPGADCGLKIVNILKKLQRKGGRVVGIMSLSESGESSRRKQPAHLDRMRTARPQSIEDLTTRVCSVEEVIHKLMPSDCPITFAPGGRPISARSRQLDDQTWVIFLLNESNEPQAITIKSQPGWCEQEEDLSAGSTKNSERLRTSISYIPDNPVHFVNSQILNQTGADNSELLFRPGESKMFYINSRRMSAAKEGSATLSPTCDEERTQTDKLASLLCTAGPELALTNWQLNLPNGKLLRLQGRLRSWHELGFGTYSGFLSYTTRFSWDGISSEAILDLGQVCYAATVWLNGREVGDSVFTPFLLRLTGLTKGWHNLRVDVLNTLANSICGTEERERDLEKKGSFIGTYAPLYLPLDRKKIPSGLIGPVALRPIERSMGISPAFSTHAQEDRASSCTFA